MKIRQITLENFGIYGRKTFDFCAAPLVLVYGPNESGKTTALNGIRQSLFGFPVRTPYNFGKTIQASLALESRDGRLVEFTRRKAREDVVEGKVDASPVAASVIEGLLCNTPLKDYEALFGFSLSELQRGEEALKTTPLSQALAGGGLLGISTLQDLQNTLATSLAELFRPNAPKTPINTLLANIRKSREGLASTQLLPARVVELQTELREQEQLANDLRENQAQEAKRRVEAQNLLKALPVFLESQRLSEELARIDIPDSVDAATVARWTEYVRQEKDIAAELAEVTRQLAEDQSQLEHLGEPSKLIELAPQVEQLGLQAAVVQKSRSRLEELQQQLVTQKRKCQRLMEGLQLTELTDELREFSLSQPRRAQLENLSEEFTTIAQSIREAEARLAGVMDLLDDASPAESASISLELHHQLQALVKRRQSVEDELHQVNKQAAKLSGDKELVRLTTKLSGLLLAEKSLDLSLRVPTETEVDAVHSETEKCGQQQALQKQKVAGIEGEIERLQNSHGNDNDAAGTKLLEQLAEHAQQRDALVSSWLDELSQPILAASITPELQVARLQALQACHQQGEALQAEILQSAQALAQLEHRRRELDCKNAELLDAHDELAKLQSLSSQLEQTLKDLFAQVPIRVLDANSMRGWLADYFRWQQLQADLVRNQATARELEEKISATDSMLREAWPTGLGDHFESAALAATLEDWKAAARDAETQQQRKLQAQQNARRMQSQISELRARHAEITEQLRSWIQETPAQDDWPIDRVTPLMDSLEQLRSEDAAISQTQKSIQTIQAELEGFAADVAKLASQMGADVLASGENQAQAWHTQLQQSRHAQDRRLRLQAAVKNSLARTETLNKEKQRVGVLLNSIYEKLGEHEPSAVQIIMDQIHSADSLRAALADTRATLKGLAGHQDLAAFTEACGQHDVAALELSVHESTRAFENLEQQRRAAEQQIGALRQQIEQLAQNDAAQRHQQDLQEQRGRLVELSQQWILQATAHHILDKSIKKFAAENEPELLKLTREYLSQMTDGRYIGVEHEHAKGNKNNGFSVRNAKGEAFAPDKLSSGTREQLYLAIRMAYISHHCQTHEPLPVMMDDCFVNFDDVRLRRAITALSHWNHDIQTVLFSCHGRTLDAVSEIFPSASIIRLDRDDTSLLGDAQDSASSPPPKAVRKKRKTAK